MNGSYSRSGWLKMVHFRRKGEEDGLSGGGARVIPSRVTRGSRAQLYLGKLMRKKNGLVRNGTALFRVEVDAWSQYLQFVTKFQFVINM